MILSGCGSTAGEGMYVGTHVGAIFGTAIGGLNGGPRGADLGMLVGAVAGAAVGAAVGDAAEKARMEQYEQERQRRYEERTGNRNQGYDYPQGGYDDSGFDPTHSGDDRIDFETGDVAATQGEPTFHVGGTSPTDPSEGRSLSVEQLGRMKPTYRFRPMIELRNVVFMDADGDGAIVAGEQCQVMFDIMNNSSHPVYHIAPTVAETTGNRQITISPALRIDSIPARQGVRYTATVYAGKRLKDGEINIQVAVNTDDSGNAPKVEQFCIPTRRK